MARTPTLPNTEYARLAARVQALAYDLAALRKMPQNWPELQDSK